MAWAGIFGIVIAGSVFTKSEQVYPGYAALLPVLATALVVTGGASATRSRGAAGAFFRTPTASTHWRHLVLVVPLALADFIIAAEYEGHAVSSGGELASDSRSHSA